MSVITHIVEPRRLIVRWQAPPPQAPRGRTHWLVGELVRRGEEADLCYDVEGADFAAARRLGFEGYPGLSPALRTHRGVLAAMRRRLPSRAGGDFAGWLRALCLPPEAALSDFALLGYSGGRVADDGFSFVHPFDEADGPCELLTEIAGFRYYFSHRLSLALDAPLRLRHEPGNAFDPTAVRVEHQGRKLGYIPRGHTAALHRWLAGGRRVQATLERLEGPTERARAFAFLRVA